jgi:hypothetical protein
MQCTSHRVPYLQCGNRTAIAAFVGRHCCDELVPSGCWLCCGFNDHLRAPPFDLEHYPSVLQTCTLASVRLCKIVAASAATGSATGVTSCQAVASTKRTGTCRDRHGVDSILKAWHACSSSPCQYMPFICGKRHVLVCRIYAPQHTNVRTHRLLDPQLPHNVHSIWMYRDSRHRLLHIKSKS